MGKLAIFIPDGKLVPETETIGTGECTYWHYEKPRGLLAKKRERRLLSRFGSGCFGVQKPECEKAGIPCLSGEASSLVHAVFPAALPRGVERVTLFLGQGYKVESLCRLSERVRYLEIIQGPGSVEIAEILQAETGQCIPVRRAPSAGFLPLRLPGAPGGDGIDLSKAETGCAFLPPPRMRRLWPYTDKSGGTLAALLSFFDMEATDARIFLSKITK